MSDADFNALLRSTHRLAILFATKQAKTPADAVQVMFAPADGLFTTWNASVYLGKGCIRDTAEVASSPFQAVANLHHRLIEDYRQEYATKDVWVMEALPLRERFPLKVLGASGAGETAASPPGGVNLATKPGGQ